LTISAGVVDSTHLATGAVDSAELKDGAVTLPKIDFKRRYVDTTGDSLFNRYTDTAGVALIATDTSVDPTFTGHVTIAGQINQWDMIHEIDTLHAYTEHASTYLKLPQRNDGDWDVTDTTECIHCDTSHQIHPAFMFVPEGIFSATSDTMLNGYRRLNKRLLGVGPICESDRDENPHFFVKDDKYGWHEFFVGPESTWNCTGGASDDSIPVGYQDSSAWNPIYDYNDSLFFRGDAWSSGDSSWSIGAADHLSDQALFVGHDAKIYMPYRVSFVIAGSDSALLALGSTSNGYQWGQPVVIVSDSLCGSRGDTAYGAGAYWDFMSPTILIDTGGTYEMWTVEFVTSEIGTTYVAKWEAPQVDSGWRFVDRCVYNGVAGGYPWHMRVKRRGLDELWAFVAEQRYGKNGDSCVLVIAVSYDDGLTWNASDTLLAQGTDDWNSRRVYIADGAWVV
jgi:hypothetical protein